MTEPIEAVRTRSLTAALPRPWGADVPEVHVIVVEVDAGGVTGTGFSWTPTIGATAVQALLEHEIAAFALGRPADPELLWDDLWRHLHEAGGGGLTTIAMAGLDLALWDLRARAAGCSVPQLLGVRQESLPAYGSGVNLHYDLPELVAQTERFVARGYPGIKLKVGSPDLARDLERVAAVREVLGPGRWLAVDANQRWTAETAVRAVDALARYDLRWIEEPVRAEDLSGLLRVRRATSVPVAAGENVHTWYRYRELIEAGALDVVQPNVVRVGGITPFRRIARLVSAAGLELAPHLLADLSAQVAVTLPERVWVEEVEDTGFERLGLVRSPTPVERRGAELALRSAPGLGLDFR